MMIIYRYGSRTGFLSVLAPSVSIKDRLLLAVLIGDGTVLTAYREYEVVETGKPSTASLRKSLVVVVLRNIKIKPISKRE